MHWMRLQSKVATQAESSWARKRTPGDLMTREGTGMAKLGREGQRKGAEFNQE